MEDKDIIMLYEKGYSIDYIANRFYKFKNRKQKPVIVDGVVLCCFLLKYIRKVIVGYMCAQ